MKTEFNCEVGKGDELAGNSIQLKIIGNKPKDAPYVAIYGRTASGTTQVQGWISDKDIEIFAVNILKSIGSKKLK